MNPGDRRSGGVLAHQGLFVAALVLGAAALLVDSPKSSDGDSQLKAVTLAQWLRDRRPGLHIADLRPVAAFREYHLPQAKRLTAAEVLDLAAADTSVTIVVYDAGDGQAARVARDASGAGRGRVVYLADGVDEWHRDVLTPILRFGASDEEQADFERAAELSRYFGGQARRLRSPSDTNATVELRPPRRGCGF